MPRQQRINIPDELYHIIARGIERRIIFRDDFDRKQFIQRMESLIFDCKVKCYAWAILDNHFHLLLLPTESNLSTFMQRLLTGYAINFNKRHNRSGHLFQNRYKSILCQKESYFLELIRYIHLNPLRAGIVKDLNELQTHQWSGHSSLMNKIPRDWQEVDEVYTYFSSRKSIAISKYLEFVSLAKEQGENKNLVGGGLRRSAGGWREIENMSKNQEFWQCDDRVLGDGDFVESVFQSDAVSTSQSALLPKCEWNINLLSEAVCKMFGIDISDIKRRGRKDAVSKARSVIAYLGRSELDLSVTDIAEYLNINKSSTSESIQRGEELAREFYNRITELRPLIEVDE